MYARECTTEGIVLGRTTAGEASARIRIYTRTLGLISVLAKSSREERSKLRPHLQAGSVGVFRLVKGRDTWRVAGVSGTRNVYFLLSEKKPSQEAAARVLASIRQFVHGEGADPIFFDAMLGFLSALEDFPESDSREAESIAVVKMLSALGYLRADARTEFFIESPFRQESLRLAREAKPALLAAINEAIGASGL